MMFHQFAFRIPGLILLGLLLIISVDAAHAQPIPPTPPVETSLDLLLSPDPEVQAATLQALLDDTSSSVPTLEAALHDDTLHPRQRAGAAFVLGRAGLASSREALTTAWSDATLPPEVAMQVAIALAEFGDLSALHDLVAGQETVMAAKAAIQLGLRRDETSLAAIVSAFDAPENTTIRLYLGIALGLLGDDRAEPLLQEAISVPELRQHAAVALSALGRADDVRFELEFATADPDPLVRLRALEHLIELAPARLETIVEALLADPDARVRAAAEDHQANAQRRRRR